MLVLNCQVLSFSSARPLVCRVQRVLVVFEFCAVQWSLRGWGSQIWVLLRLAIFRGRFVVPCACDRSVSQRFAFHRFRRLWQSGIGFSIASAASARGFLSLASPSHSASIERSRGCFSWNSDIPLCQSGSAISRSDIYLSGIYGWRRNARSSPFKKFSSLLQFKDRDENDIYIYNVK